MSPLVVGHVSLDVMAQTSGPRPTFVIHFEPILDRLGRGGVVSLEGGCWLVTVQCMVSHLASGLFVASNPLSNRSSQLFCLKKSDSKIEKY